MSTSPFSRTRIVTALAALAVLLVAAWLRFTGLDWALPNRQHYFSYHPDEIFLLLPSALRFAYGNWNPGFFNYGSLYLYLVGVPAVALGYAKAFDLPALYHLGRVVTAVMGTASVAVLYFALRREGRRLALLSALLLALFPLHVINSHYATVDVPATFWLVVAFAFALRGAARPSVLNGLLAGLAVGLGAATKYNAVLFLLPVLLAPLLGQPRAWRLSWLGAAVGGMVLGFVVGCPFFWTPDFLRGLQFEAQHMRQGGTLAFVQMGNGWSYHLLHGLPVAAGFPLLVALALGVGAAVRRTSPALRFSLVWVAFYLLVIGFAKEWFIRYLVPMTPFLAVIAASGLLWLAEAPRGKAGRGLGMAIGAGLVLLTAFYAWGQTQVFLNEDPRDRVWQRVGIGIVWSKGNYDIGLVQAPWYFSPPVSPHNAGELTRLEFEKLNNKRHIVKVCGWSGARVRALAPTMFVLSDLESADRLRLKDPAAIELVHTLGVLYASQLPFRRPPLPGAWLAPRRGWAPPDWLYPSPVITLYHNADFLDEEDLP